MNLEASWSSRFCNSNLIHSEIRRVRTTLEPHLGLDLILRRAAFIRQISLILGRWLRGQPNWVHLKEINFVYLKCASSVARSACTDGGDSSKVVLLFLSVHRFSNLILSTSSRSSHPYRFSKYWSPFPVLFWLEIFPAIVSVRSLQWNPFAKGWSWIF